MNTRPNPVPSTFRYERKFRIDQITRAELENLIRLHPAGFSEAYSLRNVNNIYLDTINLQTFVDTVDGIANRTKFRIRWYGKLFGAVVKPVLEYKIKRNSAGTKVYFPLKPFVLEPGVTIQQIHAVVMNSDMPEDRKQQIQQLRPLLLNRYTRKYFVSANGQYRLTLDYDLYYYRIQEMNNAFLQHNIDRLTTVIELKYPIALDMDAQRISSHFPFRMTKNSKYVTGVQGLFN